MVACDPEVQLLEAGSGLGHPLAQGSVRLLPSSHSHLLGRRISAQGPRRTRAGLTGLVRPAKPQLCSCRCSDSGGVGVGGLGGCAPSLCSAQPPPLPCTSSPL